MEDEAYQVCAWIRHLATQEYQQSDLVKENMKDASNKKVKKVLLSYLYLRYITHDTCSSSTLCQFCGIVMDNSIAMTWMY